MQNGEFNEDYKANSQGLFDKEWPLQKKNKTVRIACIGDSFTQGIGTSADSSYPAQLAKSFQSDTEVMNFGVAGSDPVFGYMLLKQKALAYSPDIVTLTVNVTDITDVMIRGGIERFRPDTTTHFRQPPWWEPVFAHCYLARVFAIDAYKADWNTHK